MGIIVFLFLTLLFFVLGIRIVGQQYRGIVERFGKFNKHIKPGFNWVIPIISSVQVRDIRSHTLDIPPQAVIMKDNVEIKVDGIIWAKPYDKEDAIYKSFYAIDNWKKAIQELAQTNLRQEFGKLTLDDSLTARQQISENLEKTLDDITDQWGIKIDKVEIKSINPPADITHAMHKQKTAEQERRAMKLEATGRFEAAEQDKRARIEKADGEKQAEIKVAQGKAEAIKLVNESADKYFKGNAVELKKQEVTENSLKSNSKIIITKEGINPQIILGNIPMEVNKSEK